MTEPGRPEPLLLGFHRYWEVGLQRARVCVSVCCMLFHHVAVFGELGRISTSQRSQTRSCSADGKALIGGFYPYWADSDAVPQRTKLAGLKDNKAANLVRFCFFFSLSFLARNTTKTPKYARYLAHREPFVVRKLSRIYSSVKRKRKEKK